MRAGPSCTSSAAAASSTVSETETRKRKCPATVTSGKKKARKWLVSASTFQSFAYLTDNMTGGVKTVLFVVDKNVYVI